jgi:hypothetical protein
MNTSISFAPYALLAGALLVGCGDGQGTCSVGVLVSASYDTPISLPDGAARVRAQGGIVVLAVVRESDEPVVNHWTRQPPYIVSTPTRTGRFEVLDALGESIDASVRVSAQSGYQRVLDERGCETGVQVSGNGQGAEDLIFFPDTGAHVLFLGAARDGVRPLQWRARVENGMVAGVSARDGRSVPLEVLRRTR